MNIASLEILTGHTSEETALHVGDYPYGRRVRTTIRYWIETRVGMGDRFCSQTLNPKTGRWNKPKKSTYTGVGLMYREEDTGYVKWTGLSNYAQREDIEAWVALVKSEVITLNEEQRKNLARIVGVSRAFEGVTWSVRSGDISDEEKAKLDAEQAEAKRLIAKRIAIHTHQAQGELS
jgi:hypothetical protein